jgi:hypothetical protein
MVAARQQNPQHFHCVCTGSAPLRTSDPHVCAQTAGRPVPGMRGRSSGWCRWSGGIASGSGSTSGTMARVSSWNRRATSSASTLSGVLMKTVGERPSRSQPATASSQGCHPAYEGAGGRSPWWLPVGSRGRTVCAWRPSFRSMCLLWMHRWSSLTPRGQDYPQWETGEEWVAYRAPSLICSDRPPYPGFAVATQGDMGPGGPVERARVEVWSAGEPEGLRCVHESVLHVGSHGVRVGDQGGGMADLMLARGEYPLRVLVNADTPGLVSRVVFVLGPQRPPCPAMSVRDRRKLSLRFAVLGAGRVKMDNGG